MVSLPGNGKNLSSYGRPAVRSAWFALSLDDVLNVEGSTAEGAVSGRKGEFRKLRLYFESMMICTIPLTRITRPSKSYSVISVVTCFWHAVRRGASVEMWSIVARRGWLAQDEKESLRFRDSAE